MLDNVPVATLTFLVSVALVVIAYISNDLSIEDAFVCLGLAGGGAGAIGHARNGAGRGVR